MKPTTRENTTKETFQVRTGLKIGGEDGGGEDNAGGCGKSGTAILAGSPNPPASKLRSGVKIGSDPDDDTGSGKPGLAVAAG